MQQIWLITGPPGCGKTNWIRETLLNHEGTCAYLRLDGTTQESLELGRNAGIDHSWLRDQIPQLQELSDPALSSQLSSDDHLILIEAQQFSAPTPSAEGLDPQITEQLEQFHLTPDRTLQFGFIELDCGLIHGSSADVGDPLQENTSPLILLDRLTCLDVNRLFTARSGRQFRLQLTGGRFSPK